MQRLGKNHGGYRGERIDIQQVCRAALAAAQGQGWSIDRIPNEAGLNLVAFRREMSHSRRNIYLSTGIHGDEPAGPLALVRLLESNRWPADASLWVCPCLNPTGFAENRRENAQGADLNRDYLHLQTAEVRAHVKWLEQQPRFDLCFCLHEDWEANGFYVYELNLDGQASLAERMVVAVEAVCPIDLAVEIEERPAKGGIIRPDVDPTSRPQWPEAFYLLKNKTRLSYTLEAPSDYPLATRVAAVEAAVTAALA